MLVSDTELDAEIQQADECQENIFEALVRVNRALTPPTSPTAPRTAREPTADEGGDRAETRPHGAKVKLPKLSI